MYCTNCGTQISDDAKFCPNCGAILNDGSQQEPVQSADQPQVQPQQPYADPEQQTVFQPEGSDPYADPEQPAFFQPQGPAMDPAGYGAQPAPAAAAPYAVPVKKKKTGIIVGICAGGVVVIAAIVLLVLWIAGVFGGSNASPQAVVERYVALLQSDEVDGQAMLDLIPDQLVQGMISEGEYSSKAELAEDLADEMEDAASYLSRMLEYLESYGGSYQLVVGESASVSNSTLSDIQEAYLEYNMIVSAAQEVDLMFAVSMGEYQMNDTIATIPVVQINGKWYLDVYSL